MTSIERASSTDRAFLAMDTGAVPEQFGVVLLLEEAAGLDLARARSLIADRIPAVPRLRQRLVAAPFGGGGPIWVDDEDFDIRSHVHAVACAPPGDEQAVLDTALSAIAAPLPRNRPLWSVVFLTGLAGGGVALVVALHHVLSDGVGGLSILAHLVDQGAGAVDMPFPRRRPTTGTLVRDASRARLRVVRRSRQALRLLRASMTAGGGWHPPRATPCSLIRPAGPGRILAVVRVDLAALRAATHSHGASANDAVLVAVAGALHRFLLGRGERVDTFVITVPVSGRPAEGGPALGNMVSPMLVDVPATGDPVRRLGQVSAQVRAKKAAASGPPPIAVLGGPFRLVAALGGYRWYMNHQHRMHTLVSHVRGPGTPVTFGGTPITAAIPIGLGDAGNLTVLFEVLSYAGTVTISVIADAGLVPDLDVLIESLRDEMDLLLHAT